ncbi:MAG: succinyl-diaminopimelate desuccinylase, partial [Verrucomicrobiales bacterium]
DNPEASIGIAITTDEEKGGADGIGHLFTEAGIRCGIALVPDGGSLNKITIEEKGILHLELNCTGRTGHAARPWLSESAIEHLIGRLQALRDHFVNQYPIEEDQWQPTCAITTIGSPNRTVNRVAGHAHASLDLRFPPPHTTTSILEMVREILGEKIDIDVLIPAEPARFEPDPLYRSITEDITGEPVTLERSHGGSDARFIAAQGIPAIITCPRVGNLHSVNEWIDIASMSTFYNIYTRYIAKKCPSKKTS